MNRESSDPEPESRIAQEASAWVLRGDRGLTPTEQDQFSDWLAADPRHREQLARHRRHWQRIDRLAQWGPRHSEAPNPDLLAPPLRARVLRFAPWAAGLAAAAMFLFFLVVRRPNESARPALEPGKNVAAEAAGSSRQTLPDGTVVELNRGADVATEFTPTERRVRLRHGEAHFAVTKDPARPFIVRAGGVDIRAVGTAFNVRLDVGTVEVLVTEGKVGVTREPAAASAPPAPVQLVSRQRAVVTLGADAPPPQVATLTTGEIDRVLAWHHRLLDFTATPLREIVAEFNRRNVVQILVADSELAATRISASFRTDNIDGFVSLLEAGFGASAERRGPDEIVLTRVRK